MKEAGDQTRQHARRESAQQGQRHGDACHGQHDEGGAAGGHGAVDGQVGHIQNPKRDIDADCHDAPDESLCDNAGQCVDQVHDIQVNSLPIPKITGSI